MGCNFAKIFDGTKVGQILVMCSTTDDGIDALSVIVDSDFGQISVDLKYPDALSRGHAYNAMDEERAEMIMENILSGMGKDFP